MTAQAHYTHIRVHLNHALRHASELADEAWDAPEDEQGERWYAENEPLQRAELLEKMLKLVLEEMP